MAEKADLSIIILNYNTKDLLRECLKSVQKSKTNGFSFETIVIDNASTDGSPAMVKKEFSWVKLIASKKNLGFAGGNNLGLKAARERYILFLNSDTKIVPDALIKMIKFMDKDLKIGASTPKTMLFSGGIDPDCHRGFPTPWASICYFLGLERVFLKASSLGNIISFILI